MKILALVAGTNDPSNTDVLCEAFLKGIRSAFPDVEITKFRLKDMQIKHFTLEDYHPHCTSEDDFCRLQEEVISADGLVFATPIWNFSVPAHLKNVIDRMGAFCLDEETRTKGKLPGTPAFFLYTGGASLPLWKGLMRFTTSHLPEALRYYGATVIGRYFAGRCTQAKGTFGLVLDRRPGTLRAAQAKGESFAAIVHRYTKTKALPFRFILIGKVYQCIQRVVAKIL